MCAFQDAQKRPEGPQKVIVFSMFVQGLHILADILRQQQLGYVMIHGQVTLDDRAQARLSAVAYMWS